MEKGEGRGAEERSGGAREGESDILTREGDWRARTPERGLIPAHNHACKRQVTHRETA